MCAKNVPKTSNSIGLFGVCRRWWRRRRRQFGSVVMAAVIKNRPIRFGSVGSRAPFISGAKQWRWSIAVEGLQCLMCMVVLMCARCVCVSLSIYATAAYMHFPLFLTLVAVCVCVCFYFCKWLSLRLLNKKIQNALKIDSSSLLPPFQLLMLAVRASALRDCVHM